MKIWVKNYRKEDLLMTNQKKILIAEDSGELLRNMLNSFSALGFECITVPKDGAELLSAIEKHTPDIVVTEAFMARFDALAVLQRLHDSGLQNLPCFTVLTNGLNESFEQRLLASGAAYCFIKPFDLQSFTERITQLAGCEIRDKSVIMTPDSANNVDLEETVTDILHELGVPAHIKGYRYLKTSILLSVDSPEMISSVTRLLYPTVAKKYDTTSSRVERAIRHAIEVAWDRGDIDILNSYFGYTIQITRGKPTNSEFIAMISDKLRLKLKKTS